MHIMVHDVLLLVNVRLACRVSVVHSMHEWNLFLLDIILLLITSFNAVLCTCIYPSVCLLLTF